MRLFAASVMCSSLLWAAGSRVEAQCVVSGSVLAPTARIHDAVSLLELALPSVDVDWPPRPDATTPARMRAPFDAPIELEQVPFRLARGAQLPSAFFRVHGPLPDSVAVEWDGHEANLRFGTLRLHGWTPRCDGIALGRATYPTFAALPEANGALRVEAPIVLRAALGAGARVRVSPADRPFELDIVERRAGWIRVAHRFGEGATLYGWVLGDPDRETSYRSGAGGFEGRRAWSPSWLAPIEGCYLGPAYVRAGASVFVHPNDEDAWGSVTDSSEMLIRDCGGERVEIVYALGRVASFGWLDGLDLARVGALRCDGGLVLLQSPATGRIVIAEGVPPFARGDEILRVGTHRVIGLFDTVLPTDPAEVCSGWEDGEPLRIVRDGTALALARAVL
jgi:hypothetical protein